MKSEILFYRPEILHASLNVAAVKVRNHQVTWIGKCFNKNKQATSMGQ